MPLRYMCRQAYGVATEIRYAINRQLECLENHFHQVTEPLAMYFNHGMSVCHDT